MGFFGKSVPNRKIFHDFGLTSKGHFTKRAGAVPPPPCVHVPDPNACLLFQGIVSGTW